MVEGILRESSCLRVVVYKLFGLRRVAGELLPLSSSHHLYYAMLIGPFDSATDKPQTSDLRADVTVQLLVSCCTIISEQCLIFKIEHGLTGPDTDTQRRFKCPHLHGRHPHQPPELVRSSFEPSATHNHNEKTEVIYKSCHSVYPMDCNEFGIGAV